jgi:plasmid segregation protein ParM
MEINLRAAVDSGNSEHGIIIEEEGIFQPSAIAKTTKNPFYEDLNVESAVKGLFKRLVVSINSSAVEPGLYYIGEYAIESSESYKNTMIGLDQKNTSDVPVVMTLGMLAAKAVQEAYKNDPELKEVVNVTVDMVTGLPVKEYNQDICKKFAERFMKDTHDIRVYLGSSKTVRVELKFEFVKVVPEAVPVVFSLEQDSKQNVRTGDIFKEFIDTYQLKNVDGDYFSEKRILHIDIGEGTSEFPITEGYDPNQKFVRGSNNGIGHAIENILDEYAEIIKVPSVQRHNVSKVLKDKKHKYHNIALQLMQDQLYKQSQEIIRIAGKQMNNVQNELDFVVVYGGGSVLLKPHLYPQLKTLCDEKQIKVLYIPEKYAPTLYLEGLNNTLNNGIYDSAKEFSLQAK